LGRIFDVVLQISCGRVMIRIWEVVVHCRGGRGLLRGKKRLGECEQINRVCLQGVIRHSCWPSIVSCLSCMIGRVLVMVAGCMDT